MLRVDRRKELNTNGIELDARMSPTCGIITAQPPRKLLSLKTERLSEWLKGARLESVHLAEPGEDVRVGAALQTARRAFE